MPLNWLIILVAFVLAVAAASAGPLPDQVRVIGAVVQGCP
jgi:hypothetical protein